jgi:hypothetical protein
MSGLTDQCGQRAAQQSAEGIGHDLPVIDLVGIEPFETDQEIERLGVAFDVIASSTTRLPRPTTPDIVGAPLLKSGSFLNHAHSGRR